MYMDITLFLSRFLFRIRYALIIGTGIVSGLVIYFSAYLPKKYTVSTTIYTGIASSNGLNETEKLSFYELNSTFDNLIELTKSRATLETVSMKLFALSMIHGNPDKDNLYIESEHYVELEQKVPNYVKSLIDKNSFDRTLHAIQENKIDMPGNYFFNLFNTSYGPYGFNALDKIQVFRIANSDLIRISYEAEDPGIALNTVKLIKEELIARYHSLRYTEANDVVEYFEKQLELTRRDLTRQENSLTKFNVEHKIINYGEQTKAVAIAFSDYEDRYELVSREYQSAQETMESLEEHMAASVALTRTNAEFIQMLDTLSLLNGKITEIEIFSADSALSDNPTLNNYKKDLIETEFRISKLSDDMESYKYSKEGVLIKEIVSLWIMEKIRATKAYAEMDVLSRRRPDFEDKYRQLSPIGAEIIRREREISLTEKRYIEILHGLNLAKLKMKNIQLTSASLNTISPPVFPVKPNGNKRALLVIGAFLGSLIFIIGYYLIIELLDRTLRDAERTFRLTRTKVLGAFTGTDQLQYRGYLKECHRISARYACNKLIQYAPTDSPLIINFLSISQGEGKSFVVDYIEKTWTSQGFRVLTLRAQIDFQVDKVYTVAQHISDLVPDTDEYDIILVEHLQIRGNPLSKGLLKQATLNLVVANACRVWTFSDDEYLQSLRKILDEKKLFIYLNNANREAVEDFTGQLPPETSMRSLANKMKYMGITAKKSAVR